MNYLAAYGKELRDAQPLSQNPSQPRKNKRNPAARADTTADAWASLCQVLLASAEFRYLN